MEVCLLRWDYGGGAQKNRARDGRTTGPMQNAKHDPVSNTAHLQRQRIGARRVLWMRSFKKAGFACAKWAAMAHGGGNRTHRFTYAVNGHRNAVAHSR